jgi:hypothetical protein
MKRHRQPRCDVVFDDDLVTSQTIEPRSPTKGRTHGVAIPEVVRIHARSETTNGSRSMTASCGANRCSLCQHGRPGRPLAPNRPASYVVTEYAFTGHSSRSHPPLPGRSGLISRCAVPARAGLAGENPSAPTHRPPSQNARATNSANLAQALCKGGTIMVRTCLRQQGLSATRTRDSFRALRIRGCSGVGASLAG